LQNDTANTTKQANIFRLNNFWATNSWSLRLGTEGSTTKGLHPSISQKAYNSAGGNLNTRILGNKDNKGSSDKQACMLISLALFRSFIA